VTPPLPRTPSFRLDGRRALITGAGRGLGLALSAALAEAGAQVTLCARTLPELDAVRAAITAAGGAAETLALDVRDHAATREALRARPAFDILVNNAGANRPKPFLDVTAEDYDAVLGLNLEAAFFVAQAVAAGMREAGRGGSLIHIGSQMGHVGGAARSLYCASKWALEGFSKAIALDLAPHGVRSNVIAPTFIETPMTRPFLAEESFRQDVLRRIKLGRLGAPEDLMGAVVFLASDASALMTGTSLVIDGGWTAD
jgi:NAD(P)-dependent dehydrogenase (short-subunit alcohol dehydrogenase family)